MKIFGYIFVLLFASVSVGQNLEKDSISIQKVIRKTIKGSKKPGVYEVKDATNANFVSTYIEAKNEQAKERKKFYQKQLDARLGARYRNGDKSAIPEIQSVFAGKDYQQMFVLLNELNYDYDENEKVHYLDSEVKEAIFKRVDNDTIGYAVIQYLGYNNIDGHIPLFEDYIKNGHPADGDKMMFWLSKANSPVARELLIESMHNENYLTDGWNTADDFLKQGSESEKKKLRDAIYSYFEKYPIKLEDFKAIARQQIGIIDGSLHKKRGELYVAIIENGDERSIKLSEEIIPLAKLAKPQDSTDVGIYATLLTLKYRKPEKKKAIVLDLLVKQPQVAIVPIIESDEFLSNDADIFLKIFNNWQENPPLMDEALPKFLKTKSQDEFDALVAKVLNDEKRRKDVSERFARSKKTIKDHSDYLVQNGFIDAPITPAMIADFKEKNEYYSENTDNIESAFLISKAGFSFDAEGEVPNNYSELLTQFIALTKGKISGVKSYAQFGNFNEKTGFEYRVLVSSGSKSYVVVTQDQNDWYDMETFNKLLEKLVQDAKTQEKFYSLSGGNDSFYIFAEDAKIEKLKQDYNLTKYW